MAKALHFGGEKTGQGRLIGARVDADLDAKNCGFSSNALHIFMPWEIWGEFGTCFGMFERILDRCLGTKSELDAHQVDAVGILASGVWLELVRA